MDATNQSARMGWRDQAKKGLLVCPVTQVPLVISDTETELTTRDGSRSYPVLNGEVPVLLRDPVQTREYFEKSKMAQEYLAPAEKGKRGLKAWVNRITDEDYRSKASKEAFGKTFTSTDGTKLFLAVGGGPRRDHVAFVNLNIGPFPNVDIVADAHVLPYADGSVDGIYCAAVMEHLYDPAAAAREMYRVLKPGSKAYVQTPFLQPYHGYPHHYQNFTLTGHGHLFKTAGFEIDESGVDVGPAYTLRHMIDFYLHTYFPWIMVRPVRLLWWFAGQLMLKPMDKFLNNRPSAHIMASTTYLVARKASK